MDYQGEIQCWKVLCNSGGFFSLEHYWEDMFVHESYREECSTMWQCVEGVWVSIFNSQLSYNIFPGMAAAWTAMSQITNLSHNLYVSISDCRLLVFLNFRDALDEAICHDLTVSCISPLFSLRIMRCLIIPEACCLGRTKTQHFYQCLSYYMVCYFVQNLSDMSTACPNQLRVTWVVEQKGSSARAHT